MSTLSTFTLVIFAFTPLVLTVTLLVGIWWFRTKGSRSKTDGPGLLLAAAVRHMPPERNEWGAAMLAELSQLEGASSRWWFAVGCAHVALFPPAATARPRYCFDVFKQLEPRCGILSVALPPLGLPLLYFTSIACNAFMEHDNFSSGELVPTILGTCIMGSLACILAGVPLGVAGLVRREQARWLSLIGPLSSVSIFSYAMIVMHAVNPNR